MKRTTILVLLSILLCLSAVSVQAGDVTLSNVSGTGVSTWFISGEPSLILTGYDLNARRITLPTRLDRVTLDVETPVAGQPVEIVVYQDANGGSPIDASLARRVQVNITTSGIFTHTFDTPIEITQPVVWIGFYLPVDFVFRADTAGSSLLTYWAWQPGGRFDLTNLSSAGVLGPGNGTAPVSIDMGGNARITAQLITDGMASTSPTSPPPPTRDAEDRIVQVVGGQVSFSAMVAYDGCLPLAYDAQDITVTYRQSIRIFCKTYTDTYVPADPEGYSRAGDTVSDVYVFGIETGTKRLPYAITHCIVPTAATLQTGVIGLAHGAPRQWEILPTVRYDQVLCAEVNYTGYIAIFTPN